MMRKLFYFICFVGYFLQAQTYNQFSIEAGGGLVAPLRGFDEQFKSNFSGLRHFDVGMRYMFNEYIGIKVSGNYQKFVNDPGGAIGSEQYGGNIQMYYNLRPMISNIDRFIGENFGVLLHGGVGGKFAKPIGGLQTERILHFLGGFTPQYKVSERISIYSDFSLHLDLMQNYRYDGGLASPTFAYQKGMYYTISFGLTLYLGRESYHADWY